MKTCPRCGVGRPLADFYKDATRTDGHQRVCKECSGAQQRNWRKANPEKAKELDKIERRDRVKRAVVGRRANLMRKYGLTEADYNAMLEQQGGVCAICHRPNFNGKPLFVDHCHATGKVRALLCHQCNAGGGLFSECPDRLRAAARYFELHQSSQQRKMD